MSLIGAGPGDPGLLTLRGQQALQEADVVLFDYLANPELLRHCPQARTVYVGKKGFSEYIRQEDITALLVAEAQKGQRVARLKGGDVFVFGRGGEEAEGCVAAGIPFEVIPGVSSAIAAPAYAGIPVTHREMARSFAVLTGNTKEGGAHYERLSGVDTLVLLMGVRNLEQISADLIAAGRSPSTPAATVQWGSTPQQRVATGTLATIAEAVREAGLEAPAVTVVGEVVRLRESLRWFDLPLSPPQTPDGAPSASPSASGSPAASSALAGHTVAVTRTRDGASGLSDLLRAAGADVLEVPLIRFEELGSGEEVREALRDLSGWLLLTSNQAVTSLGHWLGQWGLDARALHRVKLGAVGPSTARSLAGLGLRPDFVPATPGARHLGTELPTQPGERVLHLTSQLAEDDLAQALGARGLPYERVTLYRTEPAPIGENERERLKQAAAVTLASGSAARHLAALASDDFDPLALPVAAMGPQTAEAARAAGFRQVTVAHTPSLEALVEAAAQAVAQNVGGPR